MTDAEAGVAGPPEADHPPLPPRPGQDEGRGPGPHQDEGQDEGQKVATRKVEDGQKTLFPRNVCGPLGCHLLSSLVPKSRFRGPGKIIFFKKKIEVKKDAELPLSIFHAAVRPLNPYLELIYQLFEKSFFPCFRAFLGPSGPNY